MIQAGVSGILAGAAVAMLGACMVFMYRMVRVLNFAQVAIGTAGAFVSIILGEHGWPFVPAAAAGVLAATAIGVLCGTIMSALFTEASTEARSTVAITFLIALVTLGSWIFGSDPRPIPQLLPHSNLQVGDIEVSAATIVTLVLAIGLAGAATLLLKRTRLGTLLRAMAEGSRAAELLGVPSRRMAIGVWGVSAAVAAIAVLLAAPSRQSDFTALSVQLLLPAVAAASLGLLRSLPGAVAAGLGLGVCEALVTYSSDLAPYADAVPLLAILLVLGWTQRKAVWDEAR
ncbi:MAG TPA: branched-chain amino acid ABC transporter permease [Baekduia sp.]